MSVDVIFENKEAAYKKKVEWLNSVIHDTHPTLEETIAIFKRCPSLIKDLAETINIPVEIRTDWVTIYRSLRSSNPVIAPEILNRLKKFPNYNPILIASMQRFEEMVTHLSDDIKLTLIRLRELYLEINPMGSDRLQV